MNRRVLASFHLAMGLIYLAIFVADATHRDVLRDTLLFSSLGFCLTGTTLYLGLRLGLPPIAAMASGRARRPSPVTNPTDRDVRSFPRNTPVTSPIRSARRLLSGINRARARA